MPKLEKESIKELGKVAFDIAKVIIGVGVITPLIKDEAFSISPFITAAIIFIIGLMIFNKGVKNG